MPVTVLLVDADSSSRLDWEALLRNYGYKVVSTDNAEAAIGECHNAQPDLVLIEGSLPDIGAAEFCSQLKSDPSMIAVPVVLSLPQADPATIRSGVAKGPDDFWARPTSRWEALNRIQAILSFRTYVDKQTESVAFSLARSLDAKDPSSSGHSDRVREYSIELAKDLELSADDTNALRLASILHDVGKIAVPDAILFKPAALNATEMEVVRQHPVVGENICTPLNAFRDALPIIRHHHERMDGSGYPDGLAGEEIPLLARITQVVDIYDALTSDRSYRRALAPEAALSVLASEVARGWLDGPLVDRFMAICRREHFPIRRERSMVLDYQM
jgi:putative two-component system response regulator